eukprot:9683334-Ditylum_brightwellii.AAC.1
MAPGEQKSSSTDPPRVPQGPLKPINATELGGKQVHSTGQPPKFQHHQTCARLVLWHQRYWQHLSSNRQVPHAVWGGLQATGDPRVFVPAGTRLQEHLQHNANPFLWHRFLTNIILSEERETVIQIATIPAFLVYNGFSMDLRTEEVYERVLILDEQTPEWVAHTKDFLR